MKPENAIEVTNLHKSFRIYVDRGGTLKEMAIFSKRRRYEKREVLKGVSFEVKRGEAVGLIGHNGCGKSTTLKCLSKILYPNDGTVEMRGRVSSLLELGAGFHPDLSGRENIYINAAIFGLGRKEIDRRLQEIIDFSELEPFIDNPVRTYSSGMYMRLAFSVAINVDADVLLIDEILAVGDANFQAKCFAKLKEIKEGGCAIIIVSHSLGQMEAICNRSIWLHDGVIREDGPAKNVHMKYLEYMDAQLAAKTEGKVRSAFTAKDHRPNEDLLKDATRENSMRWGSGDARIVSIVLYDNEGRPAHLFHIGEQIRVRVGYEVRRPVTDAVFGFAIYREDGTHIYGTNTKIDGETVPDLTENGEVEYLWEDIPLMPGKYLLDFTIESGEKPVDYYREAEYFDIVDAGNDVGLVRIRHGWKLPEGKSGETAHE